MERKANLDSLTIPVLLLTLAISVVVGYIILNSASAAFSSDVTANNLINGGKTLFTRVGNASFIMMAFALLFVNIIGAFLLLTHPVFVIIDLILLPISWLMASVISNAYEASLATITVINVGSLFPVMNFVMLHLPSIILAADILAAIFAYALVKQ